MDGENGNPKYLLRIGGVLRCCVDTLSRQALSDLPDKGAVLDCDHCSGGLEWHDGAWQAKWINYGHAEVKS